MPSTVAAASSFDELVAVVVASQEQGRPRPDGVHARLAELVDDDPGLLGTLQRLLDSPWRSGDPEERAAQWLARAAARSAVVYLETGAVRRGVFAGLRLTVTRR